MAEKADDEERLTIMSAGPNRGGRSISLRGGSSIAMAATIQLRRSRPVNAHQLLFMLPLKCDATLRR
jgi:hypothetical protein